MMQITVRVFGLIKELIGTGNIHVKIEENQTLINVLDFLLTKYKDLGDIILDPNTNKPQSSIRFLLNGQSIESSNIVKEKVKEGDILAILPPVSGG